MITFLILVNHKSFTESTLKQFFSERPRLNPNFEKAFEIIEKSQNKKLNFYTNEINDKNENNINTVLSNYSKIMLNQKIIILKFWRIVRKILKVKYEYLFKHNLL